MVLRRLNSGLDRTPSKALTGAVRISVLGAKSRWKYEPERGLVDNQNSS